MNKKATARAAALGMTVFELMVAKNWQAVDLSTRLGWSQSKTSRFKSGDRAYSVTDLAMTLAVLDVKGTERQELLAIADTLGEQNSTLPAAMSPLSRARFLTHLERLATRLTTYSQTTVPSQLQSPDYTCYLADNSPVARAYADNLTSRNKVLTESTALTTSMRFFIGEAALTPADLPPDITTDLLHHVLRLAVRPEIEIRLVPDSITIPDCPTFTHMTFADHPPLVHIDAMNSTVFLEHPHALDHSRTVITRLAQQALPARATQARLLDLATTFANTTPAAKPQLTVMSSK